MTTLPKNMVKTNSWSMWIVPLRSSDTDICVTGWTKYAQYVSRLNGNNARSDNSLSIGLPSPHLHDNTIQISAKPQANTNKTEMKN